MKPYIKYLHSGAKTHKYGKAYLKLVKQHHPDKVAYLGQEYVEKANLMIQKINSAFELIEKK